MMQVYVTYLIYRCQLDAEGGEFLLSVPRTKNLEQRALMHGWPCKVSDQPQYLPIHNRFLQACQPNSEIKEITSAEKLQQP